MGLKKRIEEALAAGHRAVELDEHRRAQEAPGVAVVAFGSDWQTAPDRNHLESLGQKFRNAHRILITSSTNLDLYQLDGFVTEYVPATADMKDAENMYCARKIAVLRKKWDLQEFIPADPASDLTLRELGIFS